MNIPFLYVHGSNNKFVLVDELTKTRFLTESQRIQFSQSICDQRSAEGTLFVSAYRTGYRMRMFNPDGSEAEMCGNGLRCVARHVLEHAGAPTASIWVTDRWFEVQWEDSKAKVVSVRLPNIGFDPTAVGICVSTGAAPIIHQALPKFWPDGETTVVVMPNPHSIVFVPATYTQANRSALATQLGQWVSANPQMFTQGCNVTVAQVAAPGVIRTQTYERGVGLTPACGTAMCATSIAYVAKHSEWLGKSLRVVPAGDAVMTCVHHTQAGYSVDLIGNATVVYEAQVIIAPSGCVISDSETHS
tara:strand:+ start:2695 stop:3600 length:906 start_codon:yes stop_codon:yes gene_type:complete